MESQINRATSVKLLQSFGATNSLFDFLEPIQVLLLQQMNTWMYKTGISRVQTFWSILRYSFFVNTLNSSRSNTLYIFNHADSSVTSFNDGRIQGGKCRMVEVKDDLYIFSFRVTKAVKVTKITKPSCPSKIKVSKLPELRQSWLESFAVTSWKNDQIVLTGGKGKLREKKESYAFSILQGQWSENSLPDLNVARAFHCSCSMGKYVYVILGQTDQKFFSK